MNIFKFFKKNVSNEEYLKTLFEEDNENLYSFQKKYAYQEEKLLKIFGNSDAYDKKIKMIIISDTHNSLDEIKFKQFVEKYKCFDICLLLGDHNSNDISIILKYIDKNKIYGLLGNHDYNYLEEFGINKLNGNVININGTTILGIQGSFKYKPVDFPSFTQKESILFLENKPKVDILVSHDTQFDSTMTKNPAHQGLFGITYYIYKNKIPYHIHGHIHESYRKKLINGTNEISVYMYEYIEIYGETEMDNTEKK